MSSHVLFLLLELVAIIQLFLLKNVFKKTHFGQIHLNLLKDIRRNLTLDAFTSTKYILMFIPCFTVRCPPDRS